MRKKIIILLMAVAFAAASLLVPATAFAAATAVVCHKGESLTIDSNSAPGHFGHGDTLGSCPTG